MAGQIDRAAKVHLQSILRAGRDQDKGIYHVQALWTCLRAGGNIFQGCDLD